MGVLGAFDPQHPHTGPIGRDGQKSLPLDHLGDGFFGLDGGDGGFGLFLGHAF